MRAGSCCTNLSFSRCQPGPAHLGASGNYTLEIHGAQTNRPACILYVLDSHDCLERRIDSTRNIAAQLEDTHARPRPRILERKHGQDAREIHDRIAKFSRAEMAAALAGTVQITTTSGKTVAVSREDFYPMENSAYDWIHQDQINWYREQSLRYAGNSNRPVAALMFLHIPLPEYAKAWSAGKARGDRQEPECAPRFNSGLFAALAERRDVLGVFAGHDHRNDYIACLDGVALAYGRKTGLSGYGPDPLRHGGRVIVLREHQRQFDTWIRTVEGQIENQVRFPDSF